MSRYEQDRAASEQDGTEAVIAMRQTPIQSVHRTYRDEIKRLQRALEIQAMWIEHWQKDVECGLAPTNNSLLVAAAEIRMALAIKS